MMSRFDKGTIISSAQIYTCTCRFLLQTCKVRTKQNKKANTTGFQNTRLQFRFKIFRTFCKYQMPQDFSGGWHLCYVTSHTQTRRNTVKTTTAFYFSCFPFVPPSLFCTLYFVLSSVSCNQNSQPGTNEKDFSANLPLHPHEMGSSPASQPLISNTSAL